MTGREITVSPPLTPDDIIQTAARHLPENTIICDGSLSAQWPYQLGANDARFHDYLWQTAGRQGSMLSVSLGVAIASPGRKVLCLTDSCNGADNLQALKIIARGDLDITIVAYTRQAHTMVCPLQWQRLAKEAGLRASSAATLNDFRHSFRSAIGSKGAFLIEAII